ncbi:MAG: hypothetical protein [Microviridae sp.]|nr:MAG: hypothetical protein [Microviridae sp.]
MYKQTKQFKNNIQVSKTYEGETIETKVRRITTNKEPIKDGAPLIYTERKDGVKPATNIKTDRFEIALEAMDKATKSHITNRDQRNKPKEDKKLTEEQKGTETKTDIGGTESAQATDNK